MVGGCWGSIWIDFLGGWGKDRKEYFEKNIWGLVRDNILLCMIISMEINIFVDLGLN